MNDAGHRTGANCGEPMAGMAFVQTNPGAPLNDAKVVTWGKKTVPGQSGTVTGVMDPCGRGQGGLENIDIWGCHQLAGNAFPPVFSLNSYG